MKEIEQKNTFYFNELNIKQLWNHLKYNSTIITYFKEYGAHESPKRNFFYNILCTLYPKEVEMTIQAAYKAKNLQYNKNEELVEFINEIKEAIKFKSKNFMFFLLIAINEITLWMLKSKAVGKCQMKERINFAVGLCKFFTKSHSDPENLILWCVKIERKFEEIESLRCQI